MATGAVLLLCVLALVFIRAYEVPSASMHPTLLESDRILVVLYGPLGGPPQPGDIAVLRHAPEGEDADLFVKRVIAVGGQKIRITPGELVVDGEKVTEPYIAEAMSYWWPTPGVLYGEEPPQMELSEGFYVVPEEHVVVLGDNRNAAEDSFFWGAIPETELIGRAFYRYAPTERRGPLSGAEPVRVAYAGEPPPAAGPQDDAVRSEPLGRPRRPLMVMDETADPGVALQGATGRDAPRPGPTGPGSSGPALEPPVSSAAP